MDAQRRLLLLTHLVLALATIKVAAQPKIPDLPCGASSRIDCNVVRMQQYFCIARCISFVRDEAPSSLTNNGTCPAQNWWYRPTTTTTQPPTTTTTTVATTVGAASSGGDSCAEFKGFEKCCKKEPYEELFPDEDEYCKVDGMKKSEHSAANKDSQIFKFVKASGELQVDSVEDPYWYYYDCLFKKKKLIDDYELLNKKIISYLKKQVDDSVSDAMEEAVPKCIKLANRLPTVDSKIKVLGERIYQISFVFNICMRRELWLGCKKEKGDECSATMDKLKKCEITIKK